jgi:hypothetical protein
MMLGGNESEENVDETRKRDVKKNTIEDNRSTETGNEAKMR